MGFREFYTDKSMLDVESNILPYVNRVIRSHTKTKGAFRYLKGIDWKLVDEFQTLHQKIKAKTLLIWGANDRTFPIALGKQMLTQFSTETKFVTIADASLLPHEERPHEVVEAILNFMRTDTEK